MGIYIYIYMSVTLLRMRRIIIIITCIYVPLGRHGFPGIFPAKVGMQLPLVAKVLREASALMRISSYNNNYTSLLRIVSHIQTVNRKMFPLILILL